MKDEAQADHRVRKSSRQRVPNSFYTEGINELKKTPRPTKEQGKSQRKKSKVYQQSQEASYMNDYGEEGRSQPNNNNDKWYNCKLPTNGSTVKVQFLLSPSESSSNHVKKQDPPAKSQKKSGLSTDLLSLFQKAIQNVNDEEPGVKQGQQEFLLKATPRPKPQPVVKPRRPQDAEGKILNVKRTANKLLINHSKLGQVQVEMEGSEESQGQAMDLQMVQEFRNKMQNSQYFEQLPLFN